MATVKTNAKAKSEASATSATSFKVDAKVLQKIKTAVTGWATADRAVDVAIASKESAQLKLASAIREGNFPDRKTADEIVRPIVLDAYNKAGKDADYGRSQFSRLLGLAFPKDESAAAQLEKAIENNEGVNNLYRFANGGLKYDKKGKIVEVQRDRRGGSNAKKPIDTLKFNLTNALTAAKTAKLDKVQVANAIAEAWTENKYGTLEELMDLLKD